MKSLLITVLIVGSLILFFDLFVAPPAERDVFSPPAETYDPIASIPDTAPPADPLANISPEISQKIEQFETQPLPEVKSNTPAMGVKGEALRAEWTIKDSK